MRRGAKAVDVRVRAASFGIGPATASRRSSTSLPSRVSCGVSSDALALLLRTTATSGGDDAASNEPPCINAGQMTRSRVSSRRRQVSAPHRPEPRGGRTNKAPIVGVGWGMGPLTSPTLVCLRSRNKFLRHCVKAPDIAALPGCLRGRHGTSPGVAEITQVDRFAPGVVDRSRPGGQVCPPRPSACRVRCRSGTDSLRLEDNIMQTRRGLAASALAVAFTLVAAPGAQAGNPFDSGPIADFMNIFREQAIPRETVAWKGARSPAPSWSPRASAVSTTCFVAGRPCATASASAARAFPGRASRPSP